MSDFRECAFKKKKKKKESTAKSIYLQSLSFHRNCKKNYPKLTTTMKQFLLFSTQFSERFIVEQSYSIIQILPWQKVVKVFRFSSVYQHNKYYVLSNLCIVEQLEAQSLLITIFCGKKNQNKKNLHFFLSICNAFILTFSFCFQKGKPVRSGNPGVERPHSHTL